jgi:hypothetical protein
MRPLPVCRVGEEWLEINSSIEYKMGVVFAGQVDREKWAVRLKGLEDEQEVACDDGQGYPGDG